MKIEDFLNNEVVDFASYSTLRAIASGIDGLKNSHRKVVNYMKDNGSKEKKVFNLGGEIMTSQEYLHGNINPSIITLAQNFCTSNNLPLFTREGNFGTRFNQEPSADRYIYTQNEDYFNDLFIKDDNQVLIKQIFEGKEIEPRFFLPTLPLILINGSEGIATGFAQKILPRNIKEIINYIKDYLNSNDLSGYELKPFFNNFNGIINQVENSNNKLDIIGKIDISNLKKNKVLITELPSGYDLSSYIKLLDKLEEDKKIRNYQDLSENDSFKFEISLNLGSKDISEDKLIDLLKLKKTITENYTIIDEHNRIKVFDCAKEILDYYIEIKLKYLEKRKEATISKMKKDLFEQSSKYYFIKGIVDGSILINKKTKNEIIEQLENNEKIKKSNDSYEYLLRMPIYSLTKEVMDKLLEKIKIDNENLKKYTETSLKDLWIAELDKFYI